MQVFKDTVNAHFGQKIRVRACGILVAEEELLLVNMAGLTASGNYWMPPGGGLEFGETLEAALQREFKEETGLSISVGQLVRVHQYVAPPLHTVELFFAVRQAGGALQLGTDPELAQEKQLLKELKFLPLALLKEIPEEERHPVLRGLESYRSLLLPDWNLTTEF